MPRGAGPLAARLAVPPAVPETAGLVVYFHGGGFVMGSIASTDPLCRLLEAQSGVRVLSVDYRLAPEDPYPAALEDAIAAYPGPGPTRRGAVRRHAILRADDLSGMPPALVESKLTGRSTVDRPSSSSASPGHTERGRRGRCATRNRRVCVQVEPRPGATVTGTRVDQSRSLDGRPDRRE